MLQKIVYGLIFIVVIDLVACYPTERLLMAQTLSIDLPKPQIQGSLEKAILKRRSVRTFTDQSLTLEQISQLLWAGQGITGDMGGKALRAAPSAGALYPMELYVFTRDGVYHYRPKEHTLVVVKEADLRSQLAQAAYGQPFVGQAPVTIVLCGIYSRVTDKYSERGVQYTHNEVGHIAQNIHLQAVALGLGSVPVAAFVPGEVEKVLSLPEEQEPLYIIPVGYPR